MVGVFAGYDVPVPMGLHEGGSRITSPIFANFIKEALKDTPPQPFRVPSGMRFLKVNPTDGSPVLDDSKYIWEAFIAGAEPDIDHQKLVKEMRERKEYQEYLSQHEENHEQSPYLDPPPRRGPTSTDIGIGGLY